MKKKCGIMESFSSPSDYVSNTSMGDEEESSQRISDLDYHLGLDYEPFLKNPQQFGYGDAFKDECDPPYGMFLENLKDVGNGGYIVQIGSDILRYEDEFDECDPSYEIFLENLRDVGDEGYIVQIGSVILPYEGKEKNVGRNRILKSDSKRVKAEVPENFSGFSRKAKAFTPKTVNKSLEVSNVGSKNILRGVAGVERKRRVHKNQVEENAEIYSVPCEPKEEPVTDSVPSKPSGEPSVKMDSVRIDENNTQFLNSRDKPGNNMEKSHECDHTSIYQKNDGSCSDLEILELDNIPCHEAANTPFVPSKCYQSLPGEESWGGIETSSQSQFRDKLMDLLKIPYNRKEFDNLWQEVTDRKPVEGQKELRHGRIKSYVTKTIGKSYLDYYQELRMKVDEFRRDRRKLLYLLRGFFYWLENTAHEGAFQPWMDSLCLKALG